MGKNCNLCERANNFNEGLIGDNYENKRVMFVLHISDERALESGYSEAYKKTNTGKTVDKILFAANLNLDDIILTNFYKCIIPGDKSPRKQEYENCKGILKNQIKKTKPKKIVFFGSPVYNHAFSKSDEIFEEVVGKVRLFGELEVFISYHPSGLRFKWDEEKERIYGNMKDYLLK